MFDRASRDLCVLYYALVHSRRFCIDAPIFSGCLNIVTVSRDYFQNSLTLMLINVRYNSCNRLTD